MDAPALGGAPRSRPAVLGVLVRAGADPNEPDRRGATPLHTAAAFSEVPAVLEALLEAGADPNAEGIYGWTPLHAAAAFRRTGANVEILARGGARVDTPDRRGLAPLHWAGMRTKAPAIVKALLAAGAEPRRARQACANPPSLRGGERRSSPRSRRSPSRRRRRPRRKRFRRKDPYRRRQARFPLPGYGGVQEVGGVGSQLQSFISAIKRALNITPPLRGSRRS